MATPSLINALRLVNFFAYHAESKTAYLPKLPSSRRRMNRYSNVSQEELEKILEELECFELDHRNKKGFAYFRRTGLSEIALEESERFFDTQKG